MLDMDRTVGPWRLRVWALLLNLIANAVALFGIVEVVRGGPPWIVSIGIVITGVCVAALARPARHIDPFEGRGES